MDSFNKAFSQLADLFRSMTPGARITSGLLLAVVVVSLGYLFANRTYGPGVYLMNGESFPPALLHDMEAAFAKAGLPPAEIEGTRIRVPRGQQTAYMGALADAGALPQDFGDIMEKALDSGSMWVSRDERRERMQIAKQQELSRIISSMSGIDTAMIFWDTEEKPGLSRQRVTTASVNVRPKGLQELDTATVTAIRHIVAAAVAGLKPDGVTVLDLNSGRSFRGDSSGMGNATDDPYAARKQMYEQNWKGEILTALSRVPGVTVAVNVELDPKRTHRQREIKNDPKTVPVQTTDKTRSSVREGTDPAGRPGYQANAPMALSSTANKASNHQEDEESEQTTVNALSGSTIEIENQGLIPQRVTVSIGVPTSYFEKIWQNRKAPDPAAQAAGAAQAPTQAELDQIRQQEVANIRSAVAALLPPADGVADPTELVTVTAFQDIAPPEMPEPAMSEKAMTWLGQSWSTLGMILLALVSLVLLRSMIRSSPVLSQAAPAPMMAAKEDEKEEEKESKMATNRILRFQSGTSLKDELSMLVADDPDAAANILRTWIGHPG